MGNYNDLLVSRLILTNWPNYVQCEIGNSEEMCAASTGKRSDETMNSSAVSGMRFFLSSFTIWPSDKYDREALSA